MRHSRRPFCACMGLRDVGKSRCCRRQSAATMAQHALAGRTPMLTIVHTLSCGLCAVPSFRLSSSRVRLLCRPESPCPQAWPREQAHLPCQLAPSPLQSQLLQAVLWVPLDQVGRECLGSRTCTCSCRAGSASLAPQRHACKTILPLGAWLCEALQKPCWSRQPWQQVGTAAQALSFSVSRLRRAGQHSAGKAGSNHSFLLLLLSQPRIVMDSCSVISWARSLSHACAGQDRPATPLAAAASPAGTPRPSPRAVDYHPDFARPSTPLTGQVLILMLQL